VAAVAAWLIGAISLRTRGVHFIMITLAFAQMLYYTVVSLKTYGGDDGLSLPGRSHLGGLDLGDDTTFYYVVLALGVAVFIAIWRLLNARFGHALQAIRENETRMAAIGFAVLRIQRVATRWMRSTAKPMAAMRVSFSRMACTLAGALAGLAGALLANHASFVSPALLQWHQSGVLMVMVILGGVGHLWGGVIGAVAFLLLEELLTHYTEHWQFALGAILLAVVLVLPNGLMSLGRRGRRA